MLLEKCIILGLYLTGNYRKRLQWKFLSNITFVASLYLKQQFYKFKFIFFKILLNLAVRNTIAKGDFGWMKILK